MRTIVYVFAAAVLAVAVSGAASAEDSARAAELYELCTQCHGAAGEGSPMALAPAIAGLGQWYVELQLDNFRQGYRGLHPDDVGGLRMYPMSQAIRSDQDAKLLAAYVANLPPVTPTPMVDGDPERGKKLYVTCSACHGAKAEGIEAMGGPRLTGTSDWYLLTQLHNYKAGIRGTHPGDAAGARMRPMSLTLVDDQAMKDVVAYITSLRD